jgi:hypothetical protein
MKARLVLWGCAVASLVPAGAAGADAPVPPPKAEFGACQADVEKLCKDVKPGEGRIFSCLAKHMGEVSAGCRAAAHAGHQVFHGGMTSIADACREDAERLCSDVKRGGGSLVACLGNQKVALAPACRAVVEDMQGRMGEARDACAEDIRKYCSSEGGAIAHCLGRRMKDLTPKCRDTLRPGNAPPLETLPGGK